MQPQRTDNSLRMLLDHILENAFPGQSGASRLQQVGLFTLIYVMQGDAEPVTARRLSQVTGQSEGNVSSQLKKLIALDLVERVEIANRQGRGRAFKLIVNDTPKTKQLIKAIKKPAAKTTGKRTRRKRKT
jgi:DNA-binding transcriptional regulator GbsR (MarR family)